MILNKPFKTTLAAATAGLALAAASASADVLFTETFSGSDAPLVGTTTGDKNNWTGDPEGKVKQNGSQKGSWCIYHPVAIASGKVYTLEGNFTWSNPAENSGFGLAFATSDSGPGTGGNTWSEGKHVYGSTYRSSSGYMFGFAGPASGKPLGATLKPGANTDAGTLKVILNTMNPAEYTVQMFDTAGNANGSAVAIGQPKLTHIVVSSGANGSINSVTLTESATAPKNMVTLIENTPAPEKSKPLTKIATVPKKSEPLTKSATVPEDATPALLGLGEITLTLRPAK